MGANLIEVVELHVILMALVVVCSPGSDGAIGHKGTLARAHGCGHRSRWRFERSVRNDERTRRGILLAGIRVMLSIKRVLTGLSPRVLHPNPRQQAESSFMNFTAGSWNSP